MTVFVATLGSTATPGETNVASRGGVATGFATFGNAAAVEGSENVAIRGGVAKLGGPWTATLGTVATFVSAGKFGEFDVARRGGVANVSGLGFATFWVVATLVILAPNG